MPRPRDFTVHTVNLPTSLSQEVSLLLLNPTTGRVRWGAFSSLVEQLLTDWLDQHRKLHTFEDGDTIPAKADEIAKDFKEG